MSKIEQRERRQAEIESGGSQEGIGGGGSDSSDDEGDTNEPGSNVRFNS